MGGLFFLFFFVVSKLLLGLFIFEFSDLMIVIDNFLISYCFQKGVFGVVYSVRFNDFIIGNNEEVGMVVF